MAEDFYQFLENKGESTKRIHATVDMAKALSEVFKRYSIQTRKFAWKKLTSKQGQEEMNKLLRTPGRPLNTFRTLWTR